MSAHFLAVVHRDPCSYCGANAAELDHIEPRARGGEDGYENLTATCERCNQSKGARSLLSFLLHHNRPLTAGQRMKLNFGLRVRARRLELGLTRADLALTLGTDLMSISRWERGASQPRGDAAVRIAKALETDLFALYKDGAR